MIEAAYDGSVEGLFAILAKVCGGAPLPDRILRRPAPFQAGREEPDLFGSGHGLRERDAAGFIPENPRETGAAGPAGPEEFFALSAGAFDAFLCAWMSEFPIEREIIRFGRKVIFAAQKAGAKVPGGLKSIQARQAAEQARTDRGDPDVDTVFRAACRVRREVERILGFLRFKAGPGGIYTARCAPDHFVLPCLGRHFTRRFGESPWLIIDEKRGLCLRGNGSGEPLLLPLPAGTGERAFSDAGEGGPSQNGDPWEDLWRTYHRAINNPDRNKPGLQRQFIPFRYWKFLPELDGS